MAAALKGGRGTHPGVVELGLDADHLAFLLVLRAEDVELIVVERPELVSECQRVGWFRASTYVSASSASGMISWFRAILGRQRLTGQFCDHFDGFRVRFQTEKSLR